MTTLYTHIDENKRDSFFLVVYFVIFITIVSWFIGYVFLGLNETASLIFAVLVSGVSALVSYYESDNIVLNISGAKPVSAEANPYLHNLVENMCLASGLPKPKIFMIKDTAMNAFAAGRDPNNSVICFTSGIVERLEKRELEGVIAHELSHIGNFDIRIMTLVSVLVGTITLLSDWFTRGMFHGSSFKSRSSRKSSQIDGFIFLIGIVLILLSPVVATLMKLALSRRREYLADATAALITRYPAGLANALKKISQDPEILEAANGATAHLYISNPLKNAHAGVISHLYSTHPPIEERISRLENM